MLFWWKLSASGPSTVMKCVQALSRAKCRMSRPSAAVPLKPGSMLTVVTAWPLWTGVGIASCSCGKWLSAALYDEP